MRSWGIFLVVICTLYVLYVVFKYNLTFFVAWSNSDSQSGSERFKSSLISVKEAEKTFDNTDFGGTFPKSSTSDVNSMHGTVVSIRNGDDESETNSENSRKEKIKRNTVSPVSSEILEGRLGTPESLSAKGDVSHINIR